jgi:hypothetical protein
VGKMDERHITSKIISSQVEEIIIPKNMETLFPIRIQGILNPEIEKLKEFL